VRVFNRPAPAGPRARGWTMGTLGRAFVAVVVVIGAISTVYTIYITHGLTRWGPPTAQQGVSAAPSEAPALSDQDQSDSGAVASAEAAASDASEAASEAMNVSAEPASPSSAQSQFDQPTDSATASAPVEGPDGRTSASGDWYMIDLHDPYLSCHRLGDSEPGGGPSFHPTPQEWMATMQTHGWHWSNFRQNGDRADVMAMDRVEIPFYRGRQPCIHAELFVLSRLDPQRALEAATVIGYGH
jgi:hypothetical protein